MSKNALLNSTIMMIGCQDQLIGQVISCDSCMYRTMVGELRQMMGCKDKSTYWKMYTSHRAPSTCNYRFKRLIKFIKLFPLFAPMPLACLCVVLIVLQMFPIIPTKISTRKKMWNWQTVQSGSDNLMARCHVGTWPLTPPVKGLALDLPEVYSLRWDLSL